MNENSKNAKSETSTIFSENLSQNSKSAHSDMYEYSDMQKCLKLLSEGQELIGECAYSAEFIFGLIKQIFNGDYTREEALDILQENYTIFLWIKLDIKEYNNKISDFLEHFQICKTF